MIGLEPVEVLSKTKELSDKEEVRANVEKNCLIVTYMSLDIGWFYF